LTSEQLKKQASFVNWGFGNIWGIDEDISYPYFLKWKKFGDINVLEFEEKFDYTGISIEPELSVRLSNDKILLEKDIDYTISYGENKNVVDGGIILINGIGTYQGVFSETINFDIVPKELNISSGNVENKVYDGTTSATITAATLVGVIGGDVVSVNPAGEFADKNVGTAKAVNATLTGTDAGNYKIAAPTGLTANITRKPLVVSLSPKTYNISLADDLPNFAENLTYTSFAQGDTKDVINGTTNINCSYQKGISPEGTYSITLSGSLVAANYQISYDNAGLFLIVGDGGTSIGKIQKSDSRYGIRFTENIVSDNAEISVILPNSEKTADIKLVVYDNVGNVVFTSTNKGNKTVWNLTNNAGRFVGNGAYLVVVEAKGVNGSVYIYSAKLGVNR
jgi:hypothetical protein